MKKLFFILLTLLVTQVWAQQDSVHFFIEREMGDTAPLRAGQEVKVCYAATQKMDELTPPDWGELQVLTDKTPFSKKVGRRINDSIHNGIQDGYSYKIRVPHANKLTIPSTTALIGGKEYRCEAIDYDVFPAISESDITCSITTTPEKILPNQRFKLRIIFNVQPDEEYPVLIPEHIKLLNSTPSVYRSTKEQHGKHTFEYTCVYLLIAPERDSYTLTFEPIQFGNVTYQIPDYTVKATSGIDIGFAQDWIYPCLIIFVLLFFSLCLRYLFCCR